MNSISCRTFLSHVNCVIRSRPRRFRSRTSCSAGAVAGSNPVEPTILFANQRRESWRKRSGADHLYSPQAVVVFTPRVSKITRGIIYTALKLTLTRRVRGGLKTRALEPLELSARSTRRLSFRRVEKDRLPLIHNSFYAFYCSYCEYEVQRI